MHLERQGSWTIDQCSFDVVFLERVVSFFYKIDEICIAVRFFINRAMAYFTIFCVKKHSFNYPHDIFSISKQIAVLAKVFP